MEEIIRFKSLDGVQLVGTVSMPSDAPLHAVLLAHGLPSSRDEWGFYRDFARTLNAAGVASLRFDFRFNGDSAPGQLSNLTLAQLVVDLEAAYRVLTTRVPLSVRVAVVGTSCGGAVVTRWASAIRRPQTRIFLMAPVLDYVYEATGLRKTFDSVPSDALLGQVLAMVNSGRKFNDEIGYGLPMLCDALAFDAASDLRDCGNEVTIFHGTADSVVPFDTSKEIATLIPRIQLISVDAVGHGFAVQGDDDLTHPSTKQHHESIYAQVLARLPE